MAMDLGAALALVGLAPGADADEVRTVRRSILRSAHPDISAERDAHLRMVALTEAFAVIDAAVATAIDGRIPTPERVEVGRSTERAPAAGPGPDVAEILVDGDTIFIGAPPDEAYQRLLEAAAGIGGIGHVDRGLGLLEVIVRFEGGPSCSVLMTLQGRAFGTDVFCTMDSIEAAPTPEIAPVIHALTDSLAGRG